jgi:glucose/arabinose dehydrogenase
MFQRSGCYLKWIGAVSLFAALITTAPGAQEQTLTGKSAFGTWRDDNPGRRRLIRPEDLPTISASVNSPAEIVQRPANSIPHVPDGFSVELVMANMRGPRVIRTAPNGDLFVADSVSNTVHVLRIPPGTAKPSTVEVFARGLYLPFGMAFYPPGPNPEWIYIASANGLIRFPYKSGDLKASGTGQTIIGGIPYPHHWARDIVFTPDGSRIFFSVGSGSNVALDMSPEPHLSFFPSPQAIKGLPEWVKTKPLGAAWDTEELRADVLSFDPLGKDMKIFATGLRNCSGMAVQPGTDQLWCVVNERDDLGDDTPFEYATHVKEGAFYGWPWYFIGGHEDPRHAKQRPDLKDKVQMPDVLMQAHSAPLQMTFYDRTNFPAEYRKSAFVTMHGSWNRSRRTGYKVVRILFDDAGKPTGSYEDFMTGFVVSDKEVWGRPVGVAVGNDGSLFVTEDGNGSIWRVSYEGTAARAGNR